MDESELDLRTRLNLETGKLLWPELERHFARGVVLAVVQEVDLIEVAHAMASDDKAALQTWLEAGLVARASEDQARDWHQRQAAFWAVVVAPWVLIQEVRPSLNG